MTDSKKSLNIIIAPYSSKVMGIKHNPKNWPYWPVLVNRLRQAGHRVVQTGTPEDMRLDVDDYMIPVDFGKVKDILSGFDLFISVDTWLQHAAAAYGLKGIVIWEITDPEIFGYSSNINLCPDGMDLAPKQYAVLHEMITGLKKTDADRPHVPVDTVLEAVTRFIDDDNNT